MVVRHSEAAFETVIETHLLASGYTPVAPEGFDRKRAIFPETVLAFIRETQPKEWAKLEALHGERTIALLKERRAALIAAAVTGKIDVRKHAQHQGAPHASAALS